jgi:hypothetical protein
MAIVVKTPNEPNESILLKDARYAVRVRSRAPCSPMI